MSRTNPACFRVDLRELLMVNSYLPSAQKEHLMNIFLFLCAGNLFCQSEFLLIFQDELSLDDDLTPVTNPGEKTTVLCTQYKHIDGGNLIFIYYNEQASIQRCKLLVSLFKHY